ncbi:hypothetical protein E2C01_020214 [Portunus trituberculatus]|uniref:Uncharacterized protein n=1 Tax=Portunus trituberculatus TaxID=210409 RepID=A0A5B7DZJ6_PORTR|nr:hypothetical protein [Portunus trituberculatus]
MEATAQNFTASYAPKPDNDIVVLTIAPLFIPSEPQMKVSLIQTNHKGGPRLDSKRYHRLH